MFARSTTFHGRPGSTDTGEKFLLNEVIPMSEALSGFLGLSVMVDRRQGQCIATSSWTDEASMIASTEPLRAMRDRGRDIMGGSVQIDAWQIAALHHGAHGACCRVSWLEGSIASMVEDFRYGVLRALADMDGSCAASLLVNRATGIGCVTSSWADAAAMDAGRRRATDLIEMMAADAAGEVLDMHEFDLVYSHLRVPELV